MKSRIARRIGIAVGAAALVLAGVTLATNGWEIHGDSDHAPSGYTGPIQGADGWVIEGSNEGVLR